MQSNELRWPGHLFPTQDHPLRATVVAWRQGSESLLSRSILGKNKEKEKEKNQRRLNGHREMYHLAQHKKTQAGYIKQTAWTGWALFSGTLAPSSGHLSEVTWKEKKKDDSVTYPYRQLCFVAVHGEGLDLEIDTCSREKNDHQSPSFIPRPPHCKISVSPSAVQNN